MYGRSLSPPVKFSRKIDITNTSGPIEVKYSYSVKWYKESLEWKHRHIRFKGRTHWYSMFNSVAIVLMVAGHLCTFMLRILKKDFSRYLDLDNEALEGRQVVRCLLPLQLEKVCCV